MFTRCFFIWCILLGSASVFAAVPEAHTPNSSSRHKHIERRAMPYASADPSGKPDIERLSSKRERPHSFIRQWRLAMQQLRAFRLGHIQEGELSEADKKAKTALMLGVIALAISWLPYTVIPAIILAVVSIIMGNKARSMGSKKKTGTALAVAALVIATIMLLFILVAAATLFTGYTLLSSWGT